MSKPNITLAQIIAQVRARPTNADMELAVIDFLDLSDSEQKTLIFREIADLSGKMNWLLERLGK